MRKCKQSAEFREISSENAAEFREVSRNSVYFQKFEIICNNILRIRWELGVSLEYKNLNNFRNGFAKSNFSKKTKFR
jgi:hypothetical protein